MSLKPLSLVLALVLGTGAAVSIPANAVAGDEVASTKPLDAAAARHLFETYWEENLKRSPIQATFIGDARYNDQLPNFFAADYRKAQRKWRDGWIDKLKSYDPNALDQQNRLSYDLLLAELEQDRAGDAFPDWMLPVSQFQSIPSFVPILGSGRSAQPFVTVKDYDNWLQRAGSVPTLFNTMIDNMREGMKAGVVQPKVIMLKVLPQLAAVPTESADKSMFWQPIANMPKSFPERDRKRLEAAYTKLIDSKLNPAYRKLEAFIRDEYLPACRDSVALSALPNGQAWYAYRVKVMTTTEKTPEEIHQIGLSEVDRIHRDMQELMKQVKFEGSLQDFFAHMTKDGNFEFESEQALLDAYNDYLHDVNKGIPKLFSLLPKAGFEIRPVEAFRAASSAGGSYQGPSQDGKRPGIFYVNTYDLKSRKTWDKESLFLHEAIPGHHFQIALQQELTDLPMFRRFGGETAFAEGWGLYAESLGKELGVYQDPYQYFGRLQAELWRAIRLVVDTGIHAKGWTREQVIQYMKDNSATSDTDAVSETERYIAIAGQALAYKIGELKILELRARAEQALGDQFDPREFHAEVLRDGSVRLDVLEAKIDRWLAKKKPQS
ncbi:DUF885 domain-containing protein [Ahniella affigens]|uniref:DUF885 domain-containing protein n=1 Tax=Ahniella affigens TaxID=2021234 RepID=A0A2P1PQD1_9GAMM|nr:DUF885 family protein [Ahniella affigens]AVP97051.1 DUF885 domain-containing protein [Ahniella affigens]